MSVKIQSSQDLMALLGTGTMVQALTVCQSQMTFKIQGRGCSSEVQHLPSMHKHCKKR